MGRFIFKCVCETTKEIDLPWAKVKRVITDRTPSMTGKKTGSVGRIRQEMDTQNPEFHIELHCVIYKQ
jgi:hypothetical protein